MREADSGRIVKHLKSAVLQYQAGRASGPEAEPRNRGAVVAATVAVGGAATYLVTKKRAKAARLAAESRPACVADFESSLREYVETGPPASDR